MACGSLGGFWYHGDPPAELVCLEEEGSLLLHPHARSLGDSKRCRYFCFRAVGKKKKLPSAATQASRSLEKTPTAGDSRGPHPSSQCWNKLCPPGICSPGATCPDPRPQLPCWGRMLRVPGRPQSQAGDASEETQGSELSPHSSHPASIKHPPNFHRGKATTNTAGTKAPVRTKQSQEEGKSRASEHFLAIRGQRLLGNHQEHHRQETRIIQSPSGSSLLAQHQLPSTCSPAG